MITRLRRLLHRVGLRLLHRRRLLVIRDYETAFADEHGDYQSAKCEEFCAALDDAGIDYLLLPAGLDGLYDNGRGQVVPLSGEPGPGWYDRA